MTKREKIVDKAAVEYGAQLLFDNLPSFNPQGKPLKHIVPKWDEQPEMIKDAFRASVRYLLLSNSLHDGRYKAQHDQTKPIAEYYAESQRVLAEQLKAYEQLEKMWADGGRPIRLPNQKS